MPSRAQLLNVKLKRLATGLASGMRADPGMIGWGFAEVARVEA